MPLSSVFKVFASPKSGSGVKPVRVGVVGVGRMGQMHARSLSRLPQAHLSAIVDKDAAHGRTVARRFKAAAFERPEELVGQVDAVILAVPTADHFRLGHFFLEAGIHCLIEKPFTVTLAEADELITLAEKRQRILQIGHIERFNPAVIEAARHIRAPQFIEVNRLGPYDPRVAGIGVVMDLMIHDLDIVLYLVGEKVTRVEAFGAKVLSDHEDIAKVRLHFANGCIADLSASRISLEKYRRIRIFQRDSYLSLDYAAPHLKIYRKKRPVVKGLSDIEILKPRLTRKDPLTLEQEHFLACVREGKPPLVSGQHGRDALELGKEVLENLQVHG